MNIWEKLERIGLFLTLFGFGILGYLSYQNLKDSQQISLRILSIENSIKGLSVNDLAMQQFNNACDSACVRKTIDDAIASISGISKSEKEKVVEKIVEKIVAPVNTVKTQYVPLGAGSTSNTEWVDAPGAQVTFDLADFGNISQIYFEAQLSSPSGLVYARLWDVAANNLVSGSEISAPAGNAQLISAKVNIPVGGRTIKVQLKSQIQQPVSVLASRLRIDSK